MKDNYFWAGILCVLLALTMGMCMISCQSSKPITDLEIPDSANIENLTVDNTSTQNSNNPWTYAIIIMVNNLVWVVMVFGYIYFSKRFPAIGRK